MLLLKGLLILHLLLVLCKENLYDVLNLKNSATYEEIRKAFKNLSKKYHPDKSSDANANEKFQNIVEAYEILSDDNLRAAYDSGGFAAVQTERGKHMRNKSGFHTEFGFGFHVTPKKIIKLSPSLYQFYHGDIFVIEFKKQVRCKAYKKCLVHRADCIAEGIKIQTYRTNYIITVNTQDETCVGKNFGINSAYCKHCPEGFYYDELSSIHVDLLPGTAANDTYLYEGEGNRTMGQEPADILVILDGKNEQNGWMRVGNDLEYNLEVSLLESLIGFEKTITHVSGDNLIIKGTDLKQPGSKIILSGKGLPKKHLNTFGDAIINISVLFPQKLVLSDELKAQLSNILTITNQ